MIVIRFRAKCKPDMAEQLALAFAEVIAASRLEEGVLHFDIGRDLTDPNTFIATEIFADEEAMARQEALPQVQKVLELLPASLAVEPEATIYHVGSSEPWG